MGYNDIFRLRIHQRCHGQEVINVLHFVQNDATPGVGALDLANSFMTNISTPLRARATSDFFFEFIEVVPLVPYGGGPVTVNWAASTAGTVGGATPTGTVCEVVTIYTNQIGRRHRGRIYLAGILGTRMSGGSVLSTQQTPTAALCTALMTYYHNNAPVPPFTMGVWSRVLGGQFPPYSSDGFTRVSGLTPRTVIRNQRRRQLGVGR